MTTLAKIKEVRLYVGLTEHVQECYDIKKFLQDQGIPFVILSYNDDLQHPEVFKSLNTWIWEDGITRTHTKFPIVHWQKCYDDFTLAINCATSLDELKNSDLVANKHLVG